jgi:hypothetical protein
MELKETIYPKINTTQGRHIIGLALNVGDGAIRYYIKNKHKLLTTASALRAIRQITGLSDEEILTESPVVMFEPA